ncbi:hypothetical protein AGDE_14427 [Angomonas deanei]|uniref:Uncharacterized protein n=1 Tax=Angomonas deanei TaxID=59799 RepID=A0A7G2CRZ0_9TRYP|nr:hypothetical protein AGDE_14427 [Angomonas deanei]CAD2222139.1 hypothetical protein, conserved [Angomonas deanei]|eukprot:EPY20892.1 hypothetical protein AGDE_14427 [Angomonas deanei]
MTFVGAGVALWTAYCFAYDASVPTSVHPSRMIPAVLGFTVNGALFAAYAMRRFFTIQRLLEEGKFKLAKYNLLFVLFSTFAITCGVMAYVFKVEMEAKPGSQDVLKDVLNVRRHHSAAEKEKERGKKL